MTQIIAAATLIGIMAFSEWVAGKTKGTLSAFFLICVLSMVGCWVLFNDMYAGSDIFTAAGIMGIAGLCSSLFLLHIGTMITISDLVKQWKTVIIGFCAVAFIGLVICTVGTTILGKASAYAGAPIVAGGAAANLMVQAAFDGIEASTGIDYTTVRVFAILILGIQSIIGMPICSIIMKKDAKNFVASGRINEYRALVQSEADGSGKLNAKKKLINWPASMQTPTIVLTIALIICAIGNWLGKTTGVSSLLFCMLLGVITCALGLLPRNMLDASKSSGFIIAFATIFVVNGVKNSTPQMLLDSLIPLLEIFALGIAAIALSGFITSKIFKQSFLLCFAIGLTALFGAPGTMYIAREISAGISNGNELDRQALELYALPKMMIAGFSTLTIGSVLLATVIVPMIAKL